MRLPEVGALFQAKYRLDAVLGRGGFATVFKATDVGAERTVAIKILTPELRSYSATVHQRFEREVRVIANLRDPHTIKLFDFGTSEEGLLFMVTEFVPGEDLLELLKRRDRLDPPEVVHIVKQVLLSLREAHNAGLLHRDIKPANIRVYSYMGDPLRVKVLDFGIAKPVANDKAAITADGVLVGTLRYMSPEQLLSAELSPSSDIYSLGVVAFEMLLGTTGIHGSSLSAQMDRLVTGHVFSIPELERLGPDLCRILDRMAHRDPNARYRTVDEVLAALRHVTSTGFDSGADLAWSSTSGFREHHSDELLPPVAGPQTGSGPIRPPSGVRVDSGSIDRPRPVAQTNPGFALPDQQKSLTQNQRMILVAGVLVGLIVVALLGVAKLAGDEERETPELAASAIRQLSQVKPAATTGQRPAVEGESESEPEQVVPPSRAAMPDGCGDPPPFVGLGELRVVVGIDERRWDAYIPSTYDPDTQHPLLVMLHENAETPREFMSYSKFQPLAEKHGFIIVAPDGGQPMAWRSGDVGVVRDAVEDATRALCIDRQQIFGLGHAAGGKLIEQIPCALPEFRAIATTSYRSEPKDVALVCKPDHPIPYLHVAPLNDEYNPLEGGRSCSGAPKISLAKKEEIWRRNQRCEGDRTIWLQQGKQKCFTWECEASFTSCHLAGGRTWPGHKRIWDKLSGNNCDGTSANFEYAEVIWKFFEEHRED